MPKQNRAGPGWGSGQIKFNKSTFLYCAREVWKAQVQSSRGTSFQAKERRRALASPARGDESVGAPLIGIIWREGGRKEGKESDCRPRITTTSSSSSSDHAEHHKSGVKVRQTAGGEREEEEASTENGVQYLVLCLGSHLRGGRGGGG